VSEQAPSVDAGKFKYRLGVFEGPLDLLLHLIRVNEVDIADIPIIQITDQFLAYLDLMKEIDIDVGSDFMLTASTLIYIKSRMLLPQPEEAEELREELVERLMEHEQYRAAAAALAHREDEESRFWRRPPTAPKPEPGEPEQLIEADLFDLISAFQRVLTALGTAAALEVSHRQYAVEDKMVEIEQALKDAAGRLVFTEFAKRYRVKRELIAVFLALLELMRKRKIKLLQSGVFGEIFITRR
jgi:segregation and condensation protein A